MVDIIQLSYKYLKNIHFFYKNLNFSYGYETFKKCFLKIIQNRFFKYTSISLVLVILLINLMVIISIKVINPNNYRVEIEKLILDRTGQIVALQGDIEITWWRPAIKATQVILKDKAVAAETLKIYLNPHTLFSDKKDIELELFNVKYEKFKIPEIYTTIQFDNGVIQLEATQCELSHGKKSGTFEIDLIRIDTTTSDNFKYFIQHEGNKFPIDLFLALSGGKGDILEGENTHLKIELTAEGNDIIPFKKTLSGLVEMEIAHGKFYGSDLIKTLTKARSLVGTLASKMASSFASSSDDAAKQKVHTPFVKLKLFAKIKNGIFMNHHLAIHHKNYDVHGKGHINLHTQEINYQIQAFYKKRNQQASVTRSDKILYSAPLLINISGPLEKPNLQTDFDSYMKYIKKMKSKK